MIPRISFDSFVGEVKISEGASALSVDSPAVVLTLLIIDSTSADGVGGSSERSRAAAACCA
jgi:hypothetical protein